MTNRIIKMGYLLTVLGYMSLSMTLPIVHIIGAQNPNLGAIIHHALPLLFICFAISALIFGRLADIWCHTKVLTLTQSMAFWGFVSMALNQNHPSWIPFASMAIGLGTGCYTAIARKLILSQCKDHGTLKTYFSTYSLLAVLAPFLSAQLNVHTAMIDWHLSYACMASLELMMLIAVTLFLPRQHNNQHTWSLSIWSEGYVASLMNQQFFFNMLNIGIIVTLYVKLFIGHAHHLAQWLYPHDLFAFIWISGGMTMAYICGILGFRQAHHSWSNTIIRRGALTLILISALGFHDTTIPWLNITEIIIGCLGLGFMAPLTSSAGMHALKQHIGTAASLYTCAFSGMIACITWLESMHLTQTLMSFLGNTWLCLTCCLIASSWRLERLA